MKMPGVLSLGVAGLLSLGGCGPAPEGRVEAGDSPEGVRQGITGPYVSFDANTTSDLLWRNQGTGANTVWLMNGTARTGTASMTRFDPVWTVQATADFNPPSQTDLVVNANAPNTEYVSYLVGFAHSSSVPLAPRPSLDWYFAASGDFNADGRSDLVLHNRVTGQWLVRYMNGPSTLSSSLAFTRPLPWFLVGAADFNVDGRPDLLWRNRTTGANEIWLMNNTTQLGTLSLPAQSPAFFYVGATADYTLDGHPDIVWHNPGTGQVLLWRLNGGSYVSSLTLGTQGSNCPAYFSQAFTPPATSSTCSYLVGPR